MEASVRPRASVVIGLDPGSRRTGFAILERTERGIERRVSGCFRLDDARPFAERLPGLRNDLIALIDAWHPREAAIETCFVAHSARSALVLGHVRGVLLLLCIEAGLDVYEYSPAEIKRSTCGVGSAPKGQVQAILPRLVLGVPPTLGEDEADAIAIAVCHISRPALARPRALRLELPAPDIVASPRTER